MLQIWIKAPAAAMSVCCVLMSMTNAMKYTTDEMSLPLMQRSHNSNFEGGLKKDKKLFY
jgi:hypothetical protein